MSKLAARLLPALVFIALVPSVAHGQGSTASLAGVVRDEQNLVVPGASVTMAGVENTFSRMVTTDANGTFEFAGLLPGEYKMTVELTGFRREEMNVPIAVNQRVRLDVTLKAGGLSQQVEVTTTVPLLHVSDATVGEVIDQRQVAELPLNGRQFLELALLVPGAHTSHGAQMGDMNPLVLAAGTELRDYDQRRPAELERVSPGWDGQHRSHLQHLRDQPSARRHSRIPDSDRHLHR